MKISKKQLIKMLKKANRQLSLETAYNPSVIHKTSKKDKAEKIKNTLRSVDF